MNMDSPFSLYDNDDETKMMAPMASPPLDTIYLSHPPFDVEYPYHPWNLDRKKRLEHHVLPLERCAKGVPYYVPKLESGYGNTTYHLSGAFGKDAGFSGVVSTDFDYPSPFRVAAADLSSISETDRSPSPFVHYGFSNIHAIDAESANPSFSRVWSSDATGYESVIPRDVQHVHDVAYPEPESPVHQKVSQIYPCASLYQNQGETLSDLEINDDVDADGEPDAACDHDVDPESTQRISKMPKTKKISRNHQKSTGSLNSGIRKRGPSRKTGQNSKNKPSSSKDTSTDGRTYACSFRMYGCESTFSSKNEWKRHFSSQHLKLNFYRCDLPGCKSPTKGPNDFNRKDLFTQHLRRMHAPWSGKATPTSEEKEKFDRGLEDIHKRCLQEQRRPPSLSRCTVCDQHFVHWHDRMEHMSKHYEEDPQFKELEDPGLVEWALQEGILYRKGVSNEFVLADKRDRGNKSIS
ncbi:hypothetical protein UA08_06010 [Talaromyces atroroseus]|uniref:C2H2-type domain-containing protein n=1 Tax=Talaromyces atroroseus TaxID=1441469 RepID=A0A225ABJ2_TALAT|nr:hypothetical protein UA08_06010 [Talaromyces atroroseus]OKL58431.1 hypothetical protein UA08_06010 [Talaromyces atroroseus]